MCRITRLSALARADCFLDQKKHRALVALPPIPSASCQRLIECHGQLEEPGSGLRFGATGTLNSTTVVATKVILFMSTSQRPSEIAVGIVHRMDVQADVHCCSNLRPSLLPQLLDT